MGMLGAIVGAAIDRSDGDSGIKGAIIGAGLSKAATVGFKLAITLSIGWAIQKAARSALDAFADTESAEADLAKAHG